MDTINTIMAKVYEVNCRFANFGNFKDALIKYGEVDCGCDCNSVSNLKDRLVSNLDKYKDNYEEKAFIHVLVEDLDKILLQDSNLCIDNIDELSLKDTMGKYIKLLEELNIYASPPKFYVVDKFPAPFDNNDWSAFCPDAEDEKNYGIPKGIYFLRKHIRPYYSEILLAHEMIHSLCGENNPELFAMGLEEGVAELVGSLYLAGNVLGYNIVSNNFFYTRFNRKANLLWTLYLDHTRQAYSLYKKFGIEILVDLINKGRNEIHEIERKLFSKKEISYNFASKTFLEQEFDTMLDYLLLEYTPNYVVTPLQLLLIREAKMGVLIDDICEKVHIPKEIIKNELKEIAFNTSLFMLNGSEIGYSNVELYETKNASLEIPIVRYFKEI